MHYDYVVEYAVRLCEGLPDRQLVRSWLPWPGFRSADIDEDLIGEA